MSDRHQSSSYQWDPVLCLPSWVQGGFRLILKSRNVGWLLVCMTSLCKLDKGSLSDRDISRIPHQGACLGKQSSSWTSAPRYPWEVPLRSAQPAQLYMSQVVADDIHIKTLSPLYLPLFFLFLFIPTRNHRPSCPSDYIYKVQ